ncbi:MAG: SpoIIE family protein phosphatase [Bdellovibrionales bacterium]|nr:SpoIIE family protein phosphatase [Bdellovibrionales bacterium]
MTVSNSSLLIKIKSLEKSLKQKEMALKKYEQTLKDSNQRVKQILTDLQEGKALIRNIHKSLLPSHLPKIPHFKFSYKFTATKTGISGDFFDVIQLNNPLQFGILLSSCSSYSLTSVFLSLFLKSVPSLKKHSKSTDYFLETFKSLSQSHTDTFHLFYGIVNRKDFTLNYCLKGDIFAGIRKAGNKKESSFTTLQTLKTTSSSLKTQKPNKQSFKSQTIELNPKDCFILCSPGLLQRKNSKGTSFGENNIIKAVQKKTGALDIRQNILFQANQFAGPVKSLRDQTVLIMEVKDRILKLSPGK